MMGSGGRRRSVVVGVKLVRDEDAEDQLAVDDAEVVAGGRLETRGGEAVDVAQDAGGGLRG